MKCSCIVSTAAVLYCIKCSWIVSNAAVLYCIKCSWIVSNAAVLYCVKCSCIVLYQMQLYCVVSKLSIYATYIAPLQGKLLRGAPSTCPGENKKELDKSRGRERNYFIYKCSF